MRPQPVAKVLRHPNKKFDACHTSARYSTHSSLPSIQSCPPSFKHDLVLRTQCLCSHLLQCLLRLGILMIHVMNRNLHSFLSREHMNPQLTCSQRQWLHSSVGRTSHRYREVTGSNPVEVQNFFQASLRNCINCVHCDNYFFIFRNLHLSCLFRLLLSCRVLMI